MGSGTKNSAGEASGLAWSASSSRERDVLSVNSYGDQDGLYPIIRTAAGRPALPFSATSLIRPNNVRTMRLANGKTVQICEYGTYPQTVAAKAVSLELEAQYQKNALKTTGKNYTFDSAELYTHSTGFTPQNCAEYTLKGKKYVRIEGKPYDSDSIMSNGTSVQKGQAYWFEVQPIEWLMDPKGTWVARQALFAGIQFNTNSGYDGNFANTAMYNYLQTYFAKEMETQKEFTETLSRSTIHNRYFSNYVSGFGDIKKFYPTGKNCQPFTPEKARAIVDITNAPPFMRDLLKLIAAFPKEEQGQFKDVVLEIFSPKRSSLPQPAEVIVLGKKLAISGGYEKQLNRILQNNHNNSADSQAITDDSAIISRLSKLFSGR